MGEKQVAIAIYKGSVKKFLQTIAFELDIPTTETTYNKNGEPTGEKDLTVDGLKEEIAANCSDETLLILPEAKRLTTSIRYWLEELISNGVTVCCIAPANPAKDIFLEMLEMCDLNWSFETGSRLPSGFSVPDPYRVTRLERYATAE